MTAVADAIDRLQGAVAEMCAAVQLPLATDAELLAAPQALEGLSRQLDHLNVSTIATLQRRGTFTSRGYKNPPGPGPIWSAATRSRPAAG